MGKSTAIILILMALGPTKGTPDSGTAAQALPVSGNEERIAHELSPPAMDLSSQVTLVTQKAEEFRNPESAPAAGHVQVEEPSLSAAIRGKNHGR
jgi:hypothetical protein